jgi:tetratricopeptide (TPR) repeat protein
VPAGQSDGKGDLPAGHPSIEIPPEVVSLLDDLTAKAEAAPKDVETWQNLARARYRAGLLNRTYVPGAIAAVEHVLKLDPNNLEAIRTRGNIAYDSGDYAEADKRFSRYLELEPDDPGVRTDLASAKLFQGQTTEARQMYQAVLEQHPDFLQAHVNLGIALHAEGREDEALEHFKRARELAKTPEQTQRVDQILAMVKERSGGSMPSTPPAAAGQPAAPPAGNVTNASTDFQRDVDRALTQHAIVGPRVSAIEWKDAGTAEVRLRQFPMDKMPPVMRNKFKSTMNELIANAAKQRGVDAKLQIDLVDADSGRVMDTLDGKQWVGAFDEQNYQ